MGRRDKRRLPPGTNERKAHRWVGEKKKSSVSGGNESKGHTWVGETKEAFRFRYKRKEGAHLGMRGKRRLPFPIKTKRRGTRGWERQNKASISGTNERKGHTWVGETKEGFRFRYKRKEEAHLGGRDKRRPPFPIQTKGRGTPRWERQEEASVSGTNERKGHT